MQDLKVVLRDTFDQEKQMVAENVRLKKQLESQEIENYLQKFHSEEIMPYDPMDAFKPQYEIDIKREKFENAKLGKIVKQEKEIFKQLFRNQSSYYKQLLRNQGKKH